MRKYVEILNQTKKDIPDFKPGDTIRVMTKIHEDEGERIQTFEGTVIKRRGSNLDETFTVRKVSFGIGVERIFHLSSPYIQKIEIAKTGRVRRAKLYYLRNLIGKAATVEESKVEQEIVSQTTPAETNIPASTNEPKPN